MRAVQLVLLLTVCVVSARARSLGGSGDNSSRHDVLLLLGLLGDPAPGVDGSPVLLLVEERPSDPNVMLMLETFQSGGRSRVPRPARDMSTDAEEMDASQDVVYSRPPSKFLAPPPANGRPVKSSNKVTGRSISSSHVSNQPVEEEEERGPDFLTSLVTIPQVWMSEVSHLIIQPLRKPNPGERDSYEYFGMVAKAPFISCPLGFKKSSLGNFSFCFNATHCPIHCSVAFFFFLVHQTKARVDRCSAAGATTRRRRRSRRSKRPPNPSRPPPTSSANELRHFCNGNVYIIST